MPYSTNAKTQFRLLSPTNRWVMLIEFSHSALPQPLRFVVDTDPITSNGNQYSPIAATLELPHQTENTLPQARIVLDNVNRQLVRLVEDTYGLRGSRMKLIQIFRETPNVIENEIELSVGNITVTPQTFSCQLVYDNILDRPGTPLTYRPSTKPGLF